MENKRLYIYTYVDGVNDLTFPQMSTLMANKESNFFTSEEKLLITSDGDTFWAKLNVGQIYIDEYTYTAQRMGNVTLNATLMDERCLDSIWSGKEYVTFKGEKYFIRQTPTSSKDNEDERYKHELNFVSERSILDNVYFYDVVTSASVDRYVSNSTKVTFYGDIQEFVSRLNSSLSYSNVGYSIVIDSGITSKELSISLEDTFISNALQEIYNQYELAYYFVGKVIHVGFTSNAIPTPFKYGAENNLLSITKTNANYKIINRITGIGSSDNIPYYYPNPSDDREAIISNGGVWITPSETLMPSIYRTSNGANRFYNALNDTYTNSETGEYYVFENPYVSGNPLEHKITLEDIKPTIKGMTNASGDLLGSIAAIAFDTDDNDDMDNEGKYVHPYFFIKLHKFDGTNGFNLFEHSIDESEMSISMTSGTCGACEFIVGVDDETQKNLVQVDDDGNLLRDEDGNVRCGREGMPQETAQDRQNDTQNYEVWIALKKEYSTFGVIMPNHTNDYKPSVGDTFVILHIDLPQAYITAAEKRLDERIIDYMANNNSEKFNFSINFSRIYLENNPTLANQINENSRLLVDYDNKQYSLYISTYTYKVDAETPLPEISVELTDTITINKSSLLSTIDNVKSDIMNSIGSIDFYKQGLKYFIRKDINEYTTNTITFGAMQQFLKGIATKDFTSGVLGAGFCLKKDGNGDSYLEVDKALFRKSATFVQLIIQELKHVGGQIILSPASMECIDVEETTDGYKCFFKATDGDKTIENEFEVNDLARCQTFNLGTGSKYYWRKVISIGDDYIELSKTIADSGSTIPQAGDAIVQLGNTTNADRQGAIILSSYGNDSPSITLYDGIGGDSTSPFSMVNKDYLSFGVSGDDNKAYLKVYGNSYIGNRDGTQYIKYENGYVYINGTLSIGTALSDGSGLEATINGIASDANNAMNKAMQAVEDAANAQTAADEAKGNVDDLNDYVDGAFKDGIITNTEAQAIQTYVNTVNNINSGILKDYNVVYNNPLFTDNVIKNALSTAYAAYNTKYNTLIDTIDDAIEDGVTTTAEKEAVDDAFTDYNTAYAAFVTALGNADKSIQASINTKAGDAQDAASSAQSMAEAAQDAAENAQATAAGTVSQLGGLNYLKEAFKDGNETVIKEGLILTSGINLGSKNPDKTYTVKSGLSGVYDSTLVGGGLSGYWGGGNIDRENIDVNNPNYDSLFASSAKSAIRFDGSGYLAKGNISWDGDGNAAFKNKSTTTGDERSLTIQGNELGLTDKDNNPTLQIDGNIVGSLPDLVSSASNNKAFTFTDIDKSVSVNHTDNQTDNDTIAILDYSGCGVTTGKNYKITIPPLSVQTSISTSIESASTDNAFASAIISIYVYFEDGTHGKTILDTAYSAYNTDSVNETDTSEYISFYTNKRFKIIVYYSIEAHSRVSSTAGTYASARANIGVSKVTSSSTITVAKVSKLTRIYGNGLIVKQASNKYLNVGTFEDDSKLINAKDTDDTNAVYSLDMVETYYGTTTWYRKWNNGWLECGGTFSAEQNGNGTRTIPYQSGFKDTNYFIVGNKTTTAGSKDEWLNGIVLAPYTSTTISYSIVDKAGTWTWYACGLWKTLDD